MGGRSTRKAFSVSWCVLLCLLLGTGATQALTITSTVQEDNGATTDGLDTDQALYSSPVPNPAMATTAGGYDFTATNYMSLTSITSISVTLTIQDGHSGTVPGSNPPTNDFDYGHLRLALDGTDTGLILNGFQGDGLEDTLTFMGAPLNAATILASLQSDGKLVGTITTDNPNDSITMPNYIYVGNDNADAITTLSITGVPEPGAWVGLGLGALLLMGRPAWKKRRQTRRA